MLYKDAEENLSNINTVIEEVKTNFTQKPKDIYQSFSTKHVNQPKIETLLKFSRNGTFGSGKNSVTTGSRGRIASPPKATGIIKGLPKPLNIGRNEILKLKIGCGVGKTVIQKSIKRNITPMRKPK